MGFYVMDEAFDEWEGFKNKWWHGHNVWPPKHFGYADDFHEWHEKDLSDMIKRDRNHPCVIMWSIGNEIDYPNDPYGYSVFDNVTGNNDANKPEHAKRYSEDRPDAKRLTVMAKELVKTVKKHDRTRPVTAALSFPEMCEYIGITDVLDIAGYNYREGYYEEHRKKHPKRFILGSENGHSEEQWSYVRDREDICAQFLWTGIDYLGEARGWPFRASGAGILDLAGYPKEYRYQLRKMYWTDEKILELYTVRYYDKYPAYHKNWNFTDGEICEVAVLTNLENPVLYINGKKAGEPIRHENHTYYYETAFEEGEIKVCTFDSDGNTFEKTLKTHSDNIHIVFEKTEYECDSRDYNIVQFEIHLEDESGIFVSDSDREIEAVTENCELLGLENGDITDLTPYNISSRKTYDGRLIAYIRVKNDEEYNVSFKLK